MHQLAHNGRSGSRAQWIKLAFEPFRDAGHNVILGVADAVRLRKAAFWSCWPSTVARSFGMSPP
jgi:hypothetical protein